MAVSVTVKYNKSEFTIDLNGTDASLRDLHEAIERETDIAPHEQKLVFKGTILEDIGRLKDGHKIMLIPSRGEQTTAGSVIGVGHGDVRRGCLGERVFQKSQAERLALARERSRAALRQKSSPATTTIQRTPQESVELWKKLGMVVCRELGLRQFPMHACEVGPAAKSADFSRNSLKEIPPEIHQLTELLLFNISHNQLTSSTLGGLFRLRKLQKLHLDHNQLTQLPEELALLDSLEELTVAHNRLTDLPESFASLKELKLIDLSFNSVATLPNTLGSCISLRTIEISHNSVTVIPESFSSLVNVHIIHAANNRIESVRPSLLLKCVSLVMLDLRSNPITIQALRETDGFEAYDARRRGQWDKKLDREACLPGSVSFEEGADPHDRSLP